METAHSVELLSMLVEGHKWLEGNRVTCFCGEVIGLVTLSDKPWKLVEAHIAEHGGIENHMVEVAYGR